MSCHKSGCALASVIAACVLLSACGDKGNPPPASNPPRPFPTAREDQLPSGTRIDVSAKNLFQMGAGDFWQYTTFDPGGNPISSASRQVTSGPDASGRVTITEYDGGSSTTTYLVSSDGLLNETPLGSGLPASAANIIGAIFEYVTPLYPVGAERRHVRSGPWGEDLDGDGIGESFRLEITQVFLGFETIQFSNSNSLKDSAHFHNVLTITLRPTAAGNADYSITATEDTWFAPGLGMVKAQRSIVDSDGATLDPPHTLVFTKGTVAGLNLDFTFPPVVLDGSYVDLALKHNALVYDSVRNVYYASVPGSVVGNGNSIATIDPTTGQVSYSAPVGSEPNALALAADASVLYVGIDGSSDVVKLALPGMTEVGRAKLTVGGSQLYADTITVSPADPAAVAVSIGSKAVFGRDATVVLLRDMVTQPKMGPNAALIAFDSAGTTLYGLNIGSTEFGLRRIQVLADGLVEDLFIGSALDGVKAQVLGFAGGRVVAGHILYDAPDLTRAGTVSSSPECRPRRSGSFLLCFDLPDYNRGTARILLSDSGNFVIGASLVYAAFEPGGPRRLVEGPTGQVAISYPVNTSGFVSKIRLFTSAQLMTPPAPPAPSWPVSASSTLDGQSLDVAIAHNSLVYDSGRNVYYASVPGSVIGAGNSIAVINPATGQVTNSAPIGSEPNALAIAADGSVLYVGLDGSGEVERLALPSMTPQGRTRLVRDPFFGQARAAAIAVSPADPAVAAVSMDSPGTFAGVALLRDMVMQPKLTPVHNSANLLAFDSAGTTLYGLNSRTTEYGLRRIQVLPDGLAEAFVVVEATRVAARAFSFANDRAIAGPALYDAPGLTGAGVIPGASDCWAARSGNMVLCFSNEFRIGRVLVADSRTFAVGGSLLYAPVEPAAPRRLVQGPADQVAISYTAPFATPTVRLFSSAQLP